MASKKILEYTDLLKSVRKKISTKSFDALLVECPSSLFYLTGFSCPGSKLLIIEKGETFFFIDPMNYSLACRQLKNISTISIVPGPVTANLKKRLLELKIKKLGCNKREMPFGQFEMLSSGNTRLVDSGDAVKVMRQQKSPHEVAILKKAARDTVRIWKDAKRVIEPGMTELEIARMLDILIRERGHTNSFPVIAASGANAAYPHALPGKKKFREGDLLLVDFGIRFEGYCSDLTRTYYKGRINRQIRAFREIVFRAHDLAVKKIKPGVKIGSLSKEVANIFNNMGFGDYMLHGLGHGVGIDVHEYPFLRSSSRDRFRKGMVVTVEPGLYLEGLGGVREENMVLVTSKGCEVLTA